MINCADTARPSRLNVREGGTEPAPHRHVAVARISEGAGIHPVIPPSTNGGRTWAVYGEGVAGIGEGTQDGWSAADKFTVCAGDR